MRILRLLLSLVCGITLCLYAQQEPDSPSKTTEQETQEPETNKEETQAFDVESAQETTDASKQQDEQEGDKKETVEEEEDTEEKEKASTQEKSSETKESDEKEKDQEKAEKTTTEDEATQEQEKEDTTDEQQEKKEEDADQKDQEEAQEDEQPTEDEDKKEAEATEEPDQKQEDEQAEEATEQEVSEEQEAEVVEEQVEEVPEPPIKIEEIEGIDTVDLKEPRGNWLFKRIWWERAEDKYDKIRSIVQTILEARMQFFTQRADIDKQILDPFYIEVGLSKGEFQQVVQNLTEQLESSREQGKVLSARERDLLTTLQKESKTLEQLTQDIQSINQLDNSIDNALNVLMGQMNRIRGYERDAWRYFKEISRVLSDKKARELFYKMEVILNNVKDIRDYVEGSFSQYYNQVVESINQNVNRIKETVQLFKDKGIEFKVQNQRIQEVETITDEIEEEDDEEDDEQQKGWFESTLDTISSTLMTVWDYTVAIVTWPYHMLFGEKAIEEEDEEEDEITVTEEQPLQKQEPQEQGQEAAIQQQIPQPIQIPGMPAVPEVIPEEEQPGNQEMEVEVTEQETNALMP